MGDESHNITPEQVLAREAAIQKGQAVINNDLPAAQHFGNKEAQFSAQSKIYEQGGDLGTSKSDKEKQHAQIVAMVQMGINEDIARSHINFVENGFGGDQDLNTFVSNLDDKKYQDYLDNNPEEKRKVFDNAIAARENGKISDKSWANAMENSYFRKEIESRGLEKTLGNVEQTVSQVNTAEEKQALADKYDMRFEELDKIVAPLRAATQAGSIVKQDIDLVKDTSSHEAKHGKESLSKDSVAKASAHQDTASGVDAGDLAFLDDEDQKANFEKAANDFQNSTKNTDLAQAKNPSQEIPKPQKSDSADIDRMS